MEYTYQSAYMISGYQVTRFIGFDLVDYTNPTNPFFNSNNVTAEVSAARRQDNLIESSTLVRASYNLLPFAVRYLKRC
jgi:hypothetical protein